MLVTSWSSHWANIGTSALKAPEVLVHQVVGILPAELAESLGVLGLFLDQDVLPDLAVRHFLFGFERAVSIDGVAGVDEEGGFDRAHGLVHLHAAPVEIDAPTLAGCVAGPDEADVLLRGRRRPKGADRIGLAHDLVVGEIDHGDLVVNLLAGRQAGQVHFRGVVPGLEGGGATDCPAIGETFLRRQFHHHARGLVGAGPEDGAVAEEVAGLYTIGKRWPLAIRGDDAGGGALGETSRRNGSGGNEAGAGEG